MTNNNINTATLKIFFLEITIRGQVCGAGVVRSRRSASEVGDRSLTPLGVAVARVEFFCLTPTPVSSGISDFTPCAYAQSNILHTKYAEKADD